MEWLKVLLRAASLALPSAHRGRWLEEALAVLYDVHGWRRWRYAVDTALKAPLLAREFRSAPVLPSQRLTSLAGAGLVAGPVLTFSAITLGASTDGRLAAAVLAMALGLLPAVAVRSFHLAGRRGGGLHYAWAAVMTTAVVSGPVATIRAALADRADWTVLGMALLGGWLVGVNLGILRRRNGAADQAVLGVISGVPIVVLPAAALVVDGMLWGLMFLGVLWTVPLLAVWCLMAGLRMLAGRPDLMLGSDSGGTDRGVEVGG